MNIVVHIQTALGTAAGTLGHYCPYYILGPVPQARDIARDRTDGRTTKSHSSEGERGHLQLCKPTLVAMKKRKSKTGREGGALL